MIKATRVKKFMFALCSGNCDETGKDFEKGARILYSSKDGKSYCESSRVYKDFAEEEYNRIHEY